MHSVLNNVPSTLAGQMSCIDYIMFASPRRGQHILPTFFSSWDLLFVDVGFSLRMVSSQQNVLWRFLFYQTMKVP